jgi:hypothetical protein
MTTIGERHCRVLAVRNFLASITSWGWDDAPSRQLVFPGDTPKLPRVLPRYLPVDADRRLAEALRESPYELAASARLRAAVPKRRLRAAVPKSTGVPGRREVWRFLAGSPLQARDVSREQITRGEGLSALPPDALPPIAYGRHQPVGAGGVRLAKRGGRGGSSGYR